MCSPPDCHDEESLFARSLTLPEAERGAFLEQACGGDAALRAAVEALLRAHQAATSFLPSVAGEARPVAGATARVEEQPGDWLGRYRLLQKIGEGGCGIVYMAEQEEPVRRRVAIKVIKLGMDTKAVVARFEAERQALAMMEHPSIAKVLDAGSTDSGRPFFVMELVRGIPVTKYCDEHGLATTERLELFSQICHAIQHAHQKGIIHRDIKPSNILVVLHDGIPVPKVIDFGIAKATQGRLTDRTLFTAFEQLIGTPAYMSPEQAELSGLDIDTRSDVYSLGVLLYELLSGRPPFDPKTFTAAGLDEMRRLIRELDPPKPSTRLSTLAEADQTSVAKLRGTAPAQLSMVLAGDLDWIVMRCLEKDRTRRYATPSELVADIQRHLRNEPVIARPPNTGYLLRKLIRRHKLGFAAGAAIAASLIAGLVVSSVLLLRERAARQRAVSAEATESRLRRDAEQAVAREAVLRGEADANASQARVAAAKSTQVARFMTDMLDGVGPSVALGRDTKVLRDILDNTVRRLDTELRDQPEVAANLRDTLGAVYLELGQAAAAEPLLRVAVATHRSTTGNASAETANSLHFLGRALRRLNKSAEAESVLQEALAIRRTLFGEDSPLVADTLTELAWVAFGNRRFTDMRTMVTEALAIRRRAFGNEHPAVAASLFDLGRAAQQEIDHIGAARLFEEALAMQRRLLDKDHPAIAESLDKLGYSYAHELDRKNDALAVYRESFTIRRKVLGDAHPNMVVSLLRFTGQQPAANGSPATLALAREFVASQRKLLPGDSPLLGATVLALATLEDAPDRNPEQAKALLREAHRIFDLALANGTPFEADIIDAMMFYAWSKFVGNVPVEGLAMGEESLRLGYAAFGTDRIGGSGNVYPTHTLAWLYISLGRQAEAAALFESAVRLMRARQVEDFPMIAVDVAELGACYRAMNRLADAHQLLATSLALSEKKAGKTGPGPHMVFVRCQFGLTLLHEGRYAEAETVLRQALVDYDHPGIKPLPLRMHPREIAMSGLGQVLAAQGKFAEAEPLVVQAVRDLQATESRLAGDPSGMVRDAIGAVIALYTAWAETDPSKRPIAANWRKTLEEFDGRHAQRADLLANKI